MESFTSKGHNEFAVGRNLSLQFLIHNCSLLSVYKNFNVDAL